MNEQIEAYMRAHDMGASSALIVDAVLALLRINTPESLAEASDLAGIEIKKCPPAVPPWPPKPVLVKSKIKKLVRVDRTIDRRIRVGMTREQLLLRGVARRSILDWTKKGQMQWSI